MKRLRCSRGQRSRRLLFWFEGDAGCEFLDEAFPDERGMAYIISKWYCNVEEGAPYLKPIQKRSIQKSMEQAARTGPSTRFSRGRGAQLGGLACGRNNAKFWRHLYYRVSIWWSNIQQHYPAPTSNIEGLPGFLSKVEGILMINFNMRTHPFLRFIFRTSAQLCRQETSKRHLASWSWTGST